MIAVAWDPDFFYSWSSFVILKVVYSAAVCSGELSKDGPQIFSKTSARSLSTIFGVHLTFLTILFVAWRFASFIGPHLPHSMTDRIGRGGSLFNILFFLGMIGMQFIERRWLIIRTGASRS